MSAKAVESFLNTVEKCRRCYGSACGIRVPMPHPVPARVRILVVGEQPWREGGERDGVVSWETDPAVPRLGGYLEKAPIDPGDLLYVTGVLCYPQDAARRAKRPSPEEARNCASHLRGLIDRLQPVLILPLGHTALHAVQHAFREWSELRQFILNYDIGSVVERRGLAVYPLYLPNDSTLKARSELRQIRDWQRVPALLESLENRSPAG